MVATEIARPTTPEARRRLFIDLYQQAFPRVARFVGQRGGSQEEAQDVFQDALVLYYERLVDATAEVPDDQVAYLLGIARHRWLRQHRGRPWEVPLGEAEGSVLRENESPSQRKLLRFLAAAGQKCMNLLRAFYYDRIPLDELADHFGYAGVRSATVQKYKCLEKVRATVQEKSLHYEDFLEQN